MLANTKLEIERDEFIGREHAHRMWLAGLGQQFRSFSTFCFRKYQINFVSYFLVIDVFGFRLRRRISAYRAFTQCQPTHTLCPSNACSDFATAHLCECEYQF